MPISQLHQLNEIMELILLTNPKSVLDVGVGFGKYGFLSREYLELLDGRQKYNDWKRQIDGIEVFKDYLTPVHDFIYNHIYIGNALEIIPTIKTKYALVLLIDILEHLDYREGIKLLNNCQEVGSSILVSTPKNIGFQNASFGNPFETHKFQWRKKHFNQFEKRVFIPNDNSLICYIGENALMIKKKLLNFRARIKRAFPFLKYIYQVAKRFLNMSPKI
ncbi:hypothetical protein AC481_05530 [miscellaneous Crenarchaeota group archaeon SMTZ-80]|nr:MAG: hypothetical protein AC481_05530 [miscellaneous Crenarchaeota group archaeon SMTZ-80]